MLGVFMLTHCTRINIYIFYKMIENIFVNYIIKYFFYTRGSSNTLLSIQMGNTPFINLVFIRENQIMIIDRKTRCLNRFFSIISV